MNKNLLNKFDELSTDVSDRGDEFVEELVHLEFNESQIKSLDKKDFDLYCHRLKEDLRPVIQDFTKTFSLKVSNSFLFEETEVEEVLKSLNERTRFFRFYIVTKGKGEALFFLDQFSFRVEGLQLPKNIRVGALLGKLKESTGWNFKMFKNGGFFNLEVNVTLKEKDQNIKKENQDHDSSDKKKEILWQSPY